MKAAIYARVSTEMQVDNFSITAQLNDLRKYCKNNSIEIYKEYIDEGVSGTHHKRPSFQRMILDAENFDMVLVHKYDRFARNVELSATVKRQLKEKKVNVISITEPIENSPIGTLNEGLLSLLAQYYSDNLSRESKKGRLERAKSGLNSGRAAFGYDLDEKGNLVINESESKIVKLIFEKYLAGENSKKINIWLRDHNILTRSGINFRERRIVDILQKVTYTGRIKHNDLIFDGQHESIIDIETFEAVQKLIKGNICTKFIKRSENFYNHYLLGILYCGDCKNTIRIKSYSYVNKSGKNTYHYACSRAARYVSINPCQHKRYYQSNILEKDIEKLLRNYTKGKINFSPTLSEKDNTIEILKNRKEKIFDELERAKSAYLAQVFDLKEYSEIKLKLENEKSQIENEIENFNPDYVDNKLLQKRLLTIWDEFKHEKNVCKKRNILKTVIDKIYINSDGIFEIFFT